MRKPLPPCVVYVPAAGHDMACVLLSNITDADRPLVYAALGLPTVGPLTANAHGLADSSGITVELTNGSPAELRRAAEAIAEHLDTQLLVASPASAPEEAELEHLLAPLYRPVIDKVTQHVREVLLSYPDLFKTRTDVLAHIFLVNGNGYHWAEDGCPRCDVEAVGRMSYGRLLANARRLHAQLAEEFDEASVGAVTKRQLRLQRVYIERRHRAEYIDLYAALPDTEGLLTVAEHFSPEWGLLSRPLPAGGIDGQWAAAAKELLTQVARLAKFRAATLKGAALDKVGATENAAKQALLNLASLPVRASGKEVRP